MDLSRMPKAPDDYLIDRTAYRMPKQEIKLREQYDGDPMKQLETGEEPVDYGKYLKEAYSLDDEELELMKKHGWSASDMILMRKMKNYLEIQKHFGELPTPNKEAYEQYRRRHR